MRWASAISLAGRLEDAIDEALDTIAGELTAPADLIVCFARPEYADHFMRLAPQVAERYPAAVIVGCSAGGVIGGGREVELEPALAIAAASLPGVEVKPFHLGADVDEWRERIGVRPEEDPAFVVLPDPFTCPAEDLLDWLDATYPAATAIGGMASGGESPGTTALFWGGRLERAGAVGVALTGDIAVETIVAQGCRPIGTPAFATRTEGNVVFEIDGQPALDMLEAIHEQLSSRDRDLVRDSLFVGLVMQPEREVYRQGDFLVRNIVGIDPVQGAIAIGARVRDNQVIQFHLRDAETSAQDLAALLDARGDRPAPAGALLFSCLGRGIGLYGDPDHDTRLFAERLGPVPVAGFFGNGEIGPVGARTFLHGYTSVFGLFSPRGQR